MPITEAQRQQRQKHLGSSDMAAVMGLDSWGNAYDVYLEKTGKLNPEKDKAIFRRGNYMEAALLAFAQDELGRLIVEPSELEFVKPDLHLCSHPDAMTIKASPEFEDWLKTQPADVSEIPYNSNSSPAMIKLLFDNYKQDMNIKTDVAAGKSAAKQAQIDNSKSVKSGNNVTVSSDNKVYTVAQAQAEFKLDDGKTDWKKVRKLADNKQIIG